MDLKQMICEFRQFQLARRKSRMVVIENVLARLDFEQKETSVTILIEPGDNGTVSLVPSGESMLFRTYLNHVETYDQQGTQVVIIRTPPHSNYHLRFPSYQLRKQFVAGLREFLSLSSGSDGGESLDSGRSTLPPQ